MRTKSIRTLLQRTSCLVAAGCTLLGTQAADTTKLPQGQPGESTAQRDARMKWWREAKFGMFIHWGVYAVPAGTYKTDHPSANLKEGTIDKDGHVKGIGEWIMRNAEIPVAEYRAFAKQLNPVKYDPAAWAKVAKEAGMRYIVITSKHHDGFALFPSDVTDWDVKDATPYGKDLIGPLCEAARSQGLKFGLYYSQAQDWTHPGGGKARLKEGEGWDDAHKGSFDDYLKKIAVPQVREILTRYQPEILWWDTPVWMTKERADLIFPLLALRPGLITNNRLGGEYAGDTETPEQHVPATGFPGRDWETCMTMNDTWGFKSYDNNWKSTEDLIRKLVDIVSKGGNFLLNVGPTPEGLIPQPSIERLQAVGAWMKVNSEAIYGTTASPFRKLTWGRCTKKITDQGGTLFFHVFNWPTDGKLVVPGLRNGIASAKLLAGGQALQTATDAGNAVITLPAKAPDAIASVIAVEIKGALQVEQPLPGAQANGVIALTPELADIHNSIRAHAVLEGKGATASIAQWDNTDTRLSWDFMVTKAGKYTVSAELSEIAGGKLKVGVAGASVDAKIAQASGRQTVTLGVIEIPAGAQTIEFKPTGKDWKGFRLHKVELAGAK